MLFVKSDGQPFYPEHYIVRRLGDCVAEVVLDYQLRNLTCMPDSMAYPVADAENGRG